MARKARSDWWYGLLSLWMAGCSALVDADPDAVPRFDADLEADGGSRDRDGGAGMDGGAGVDGGAGMDGAPSCPGGCDDGVDCTVDECVAGGCRFQPSSDRCGAGQRCHATRGCVPAERCERDDDCDDGSYCNGSERCDPEAPGSDPTTGCVMGEPPVCGVPEGTCLVGMCNEGSRGCVTVRDASLCDDGDPCTADACGGDDVCSHEPVDADADGYPAARVEGTACGVDPAEADCDDANPAVHPGVDDVCNGLDDDCDGIVDEDCPTPDSCSEAERIVVDVGARRTVFGTFQGRTSNAGSLCTGGASRPDAFYVLRVGDGTARLVDIELDTIGSGADALLAIRNAGTCGLSFASACHDDRDPDAGDLDAKIWVHGWPASRALWILVEKAQGRDADDFRLNVQVRPSADDRCSAPPIDISGGGVLAGYVGGPSGGGTLPPVSSGRYAGSCGGSMHEEVLARFTARYDRQRFTTWSRSFGPVLYVRSRCDDADSEVDCDSVSWTGGIVWARLDTDVDAGEHGFLFVDGARRGNWYVTWYEPNGG